MRKQICPNCFSKRVRILDQTDGISRRLTTSKGHALDLAAAERLLCSDCACVCVVFDPPGRLREYSRRSSRPDDPTWNEPAVVNDVYVDRHSKAASALWSSLPADLPVQGNWLEIGCGDGRLSAGFLLRHPGWTCDAIDPSPGGPSSLRPSDARIRCVQDFFDLNHYADQTFDVIAAHGLLNRSPIWPELVKMRALARLGSLLSLDLLVLENAVFAPHVWDYSYMYPREVLKVHMAAAGFTIRRMTDCGASLHVLAECTGEASPRPPRPGGQLVAQSQTLMQGHIRWWDNLVEACRTELNGGGDFALYGAGLFNSILLSFIAPTRFSAVIDDVRAGRIFRGLPVIVPAEAARRNLRAIICAHPRHVDRMAETSRRAGLGVAVLGRGTANG